MSNLMSKLDLDIGLELNSLNSLDRARIDSSLIEVAQQLFVGSKKVDSSFQGVSSEAKTKMFEIIEKN